MRSLFKSTHTVGGMTLISRVFGLLRDVILARYFGAGAGFDVFIVAFRIPNFLRRLSAERIVRIGFALTTYGAYEYRPYLGFIVGGLLLALIANNINKGSE